MDAFTPPKNGSDLWRIDACSAVLRTSLLSAQVDLRNPSRGIGGLVLKGVSLDGFVLGVALGVDQPWATDALREAFTRQNDLVATYGETEQMPFSLQVYWRAVEQENGAVLLDTLLSLQTPSLKSFPSIVTASQLRGDDVLVVPYDGREKAFGMGVNELPSTSPPREEPAGVVLRMASVPWSYAEMTPADDPGSWQVFRQHGLNTVRRRLGGTFLEKGVLRRIRVRGALLPRDREVELAQQYLAKLATEKPPLTV